MISGTTEFSTTSGVTTTRFLPLIEGMSAEELAELMEDMESDEMPPFGGTDQKRILLANWLAQLTPAEKGDGQ